MKKFWSRSLLICTLGVLLLAGCGGKDSDSADDEKSGLDKLAETAADERLALMQSELGSWFNEQCTSRFSGITRNNFV